MYFSRGASITLLAFSFLCFSIFVYGQAAQLPENHSEHRHAANMNLPSGVTDKCDPQFTYEDGPKGPGHWEGVCTTGQMQAPIDIKDPEQIPIPPLPPMQFSYAPADLDMVNDCNNYTIKLRFPKNYWFKYRRKPYRLSEIRFREPGETAVNGKRPPMALQFVHLAPETTILIIEVPVVVGKENQVIKKLWEHIPQGGKEYKPAAAKINPMDLLPVDRSYYRFPGSLTTPICNEGVQWFVMKHPIEMSKAQIDKYRKYYHDTARPLQPLNGRPLVESK